MDAPHDVFELPKELWSDAWLLAHDEEYVRPRAPRRTLAREPDLGRITEPLTAQAASGAADLDELHLGGKLTPGALRPRRVAPGVRRMESVTTAWGRRAGNGRDGVLRRSIDKEWQAVHAGQIEFFGDGFTSPPAARQWPTHFTFMWPTALPKGQLCFVGHGFTLGVRP